MFDDKQELHDFADAIGEKIATALQNQRMTGCDFCGTEERRQQHRHEHIALGKFLNAFDRLCEFGIETVGAAFKWGTIAFLAWVGWFLLSHAFHTGAPTVQQQIDKRVQQETPHPKNDY